MPTQEHEYLIELVRNRPSLVATLLAGTGVSVPTFDEARLGNADFTDCTPTEYRADSVVLLCKEGTPVSAVVLEVQREPDTRKRWSWPVYLSTLRARTKCPVLLLVFCEDSRTARRCAEPIEMGHPRWVLHPIVIGPDGIPSVIDLGWAVDQPELATISAIVHGQSEAGLRNILTLFEALGQLPEEYGEYSDLVLSCLPDFMLDTVIRELRMAMATDHPRSAVVRAWLAEGKAKGIAEGKAKGEAKAVLLILEARGISLPDEARARILACTDLDTLESWVRKAATAESAGEFFL
ncbi:hypothetical protein E1295_01630 [Nonomuraea mesophila]|uniref:Rpn family recombination-promoting nuclease/putative transposase n=1 Tax=Nonomuraea mesophila TaxID=2530382 RepID=A0A4R5FXU5_9ACTN|nr:hypothetical protein [Nonomuraea mesophila]TDE59974.1 hypothetical protein E1295_01630 [Nonomuraea mesophila]